MDNELLLNLKRGKTEFYYLLKTAKTKKGQKMPFNSTSEYTYLGVKADPSLSFILNILQQRRL